MRRLLPSLAALLTLLPLASCSVMRTVPRSDLTAAPPRAAPRFTRFASPKGQAVYGYTTLDGRFHALRGWARLEGDTVVFDQPEYRPGRLANLRPAATERLAVRDLESVSSEGLGTLPTTLFVIALVGSAGLFVFGLYLGGLGS